MEIKIDNICMYYQHDFELLQEKEKDKLRAEASLWLNAVIKVLEDAELIG